MPLSQGGLAVKFFLLDIVLPIADKVFDGLNIYNFFQRGDVYWAVLTIVMLLIPGTLEVVFWITEYCHGRATCCKATEWIVLFGPVMYPFTQIIWHIQLLLRSVCGNFGYLHEKFSQSKVFKVLQACTESSFQMILQTTILFITWRGFGYHYIQMGSSLLSSFFLANAVSDHHFHEKSGKEVIPSAAQSIRGLFFFWINIVSRCAILSLLSSYLHGWIFALLLLIVLLNFLLARCILRTDASKDFWTCISSIVVPACFVSKATIETYKKSLGSKPSRKFQRYYFWNTVFFALVTLLGMSAVHLVLSMDLIEYKCNNLPFLSCSLDVSDECAHRRPCDVAEGAHDYALWAGWILVGALNLVNFVMVAVHGLMCPSLLGGDQYTDVL